MLNPVAFLRTISSSKRSEIGDKFGLGNTMRGDGATNCARRADTDHYIVQFGQCPLVEQQLDRAKLVVRSIRQIFAAHERQFLTQHTTSDCIGKDRRFIRTVVCACIGDRSDAPMRQLP